MSSTTAQTNEPTDDLRTLGANGTPANEAESEQLEGGESDGCAAMDEIQTTPPPLTTTGEKLRAYILGLQPGERVIELGESGMKGRQGTVYVSHDRGDVCVLWDRLDGEDGQLGTSATGGTRRLTEQGINGLPILAKVGSGDAKTSAAEGTSLARAKSADEDEGPLDISHLRPWQQRFIRSLRALPIVYDACVAAGNINRRTAYKWRDKDPAFREAWDDALEDGWDGAERAAYERGVNGVSKPVYGKNGEIVGYDVQHSDRLLELVLKGNRAQVYNPKQEVAVTHDIGPNMAGVLANVRMSRDAILGGQSVRELPVTDVKVLSVNDAAKDGESCAGRKEA